VITLYTSEHG